MDADGLHPFRMLRMLRMQQGRAASLVYLHNYSFTYDSGPVVGFTPFLLLCSTHFTIAGPLLPSLSRFHPPILRGSLDDARGHEIHRQVPVAVLDALPDFVRRGIDGDRLVLRPQAKPARRSGKYWLLR